LGKIPTRKQSGTTKPTPSRIVSADAANTTPVGQANRPHTWLERFAVIFSALAFIAVCYQGWVSRDTEKRQLRAYIVAPSGLNADKATYIRVDPPRPNEPINVWVDMVNEGQTPAFKLRQAIVVKIMQFPLPIGYTYPVDVAYDLGTVGVRDIVSGSKHAGNTVSEAEMLSLTRGASALYIYGFAIYNDIFGDQHTTNFCVYYRFPSPVSNYCDRHNDTDDAPDRNER
jgi:hypothetical protein